MEKTLIAFINLGFSCGPQMGDYGKFTVDLTEDELNKIDEIVKEKTTGYKRYTLAERYPELHNKIVAAAQGLARDVVVHDGVTYLDEPLSEEEDEKIEKMSYREQTDYLASHYDLEPDTLEFAEVCYYLTETEIPSDLEI